MRRCFRFQVWKFQDASIKTCIKAAKFGEKFEFFPKI